MDANHEASERARLRVSVGQHSDRGRKPVNQDFHGLWVPREPLLSAKGIAIALADGISSSAVSHIASETAVTGFLEDYYCTSETWSVKKSAQRVMAATNAWLHAQTRQSQHRHDNDKGYVCTLTVMVIRSTTAHVLHVGDARIHRLRGGAIEQLTEDHRVRISNDRSYLGRALGLAPHVEIDYHTRGVECGDLFLLTTDGVHEYVDTSAMATTLAAHADDLDLAARTLVDLALERGSPDNLTAQIVRIDALPAPRADEITRLSTTLPCPPLLQEGQEFDGYRIVRSLHASSRSHVYLAKDIDTGAAVALKIPSLDLRHDPGYLERLLMEEWTARRIDSGHVVKAWTPERPRAYLYTVWEFIEGHTLAQWMAAHPAPSLDAVRAIIDQVAKGLQAFHRLEIIHQDLRPDNILIDGRGAVTLIDLGSARVAGISEYRSDEVPPGTEQYSAPEYFLGEPGTSASDIYSLGVIAYQMLTGRLPYGTAVAQVRTRAAQRKLAYASVLDETREIPAWLDGVLAKAVSPQPEQRYAELSEFLHDLRHPPGSGARSRVPLVERHPLVFWKCLSLALAIALVIVAAYR
ncbi:bifunctional protein-serine/threonine kinase/phosphatase [Achromobacter aloeverae]|uniref:Protein kinase n=1 Tax=Achromobacter aloeverae TaxID=1750518 RepID=A0A4Q1HDX0_9BURK|nr:bifunctional protein-serine/threonine kinase/phosphatase [Achromobacter aloeverae]RXN84463.1 protein kinase [Achromobacter aloeverae]